MYTHVYIDIYISGGSGQPDMYDITMFIIAIIIITNIIIIIIIITLY